MDIRLDFFDKDGDNISEFVQITQGKASPWHSSGVFTYTHPLLGEVDIGSHSSGHIMLKAGYSYTKIPMCGKG